MPWESAVHGARSVVVALIGALACLSASPVDAATAPAPRAAAVVRSMVLVTIDGARAGTETWPEVMPAFARLASEGARLRFGTTPSPSTVPATASVLSGHSPASTGVRDDRRPFVPGQARWLAEDLAAAGFHTVALPADRLTHAGGSLARGFRDFEAISPLWPDSERVDSALARLAAPGRRFVWLGLSFGQPSEPWRRWRGGEFADSAGYAARAAEIDGALERLVRGLRSQGASRTLIAVVGTHGEAVPGWPLRCSGFDERPIPGRGPDLSEDVLRVPIVFHGAGVPASGSVVGGRTWTSTLDVAPTLAALGGVRFVGDGVSLVPALRGGAIAPRVLMHESDPGRLLGWAPRVAARQGATKRLARGSELRTLTGATGATPGGRTAIKQLDRRVSERVGAIAAGRDSLSALRPAAPDDEEQCWRELLAALPARGTMPDSITIWRLNALRNRCAGPVYAIEEAAARSLVGQDIQIGRALEGLRRRHPDVEAILIAYADHLRRHDHLELIPEVLESVAPASPLAPDARWRAALALALRLRGDARAAYREAIASGAPPDLSWWKSYPLYEEVARRQSAVEGAPDSVGRRMDYARALAAFGLHDQAYSQLHQARAIDEKDPEPNYLMGMMLLGQGRPGPAVGAFDRALEHSPDHVPALRAKAEALVAQARRAEALPYLRRAVELDGGDARSRFNLACLLALAGDVKGSADELERAIDAGYSNWEQITSDPDLEAVRRTDAWPRLMARVPRPAGGRPPR